MKFPLLFAALLMMAVPAARAQTADIADTGEETPAPGNTLIQSDELHMDQVTHIAVFTGNVVVTGTNFSMKCQEMTVNFDKEGKVDTILAKGDVEIVQPGRVTHSGQAVYTRDDDKFVLTDQPSIIDNKNKVAAPKIIIYRTKQSMYTEGRTDTIISQGNAFSSNPPADNGQK
jgi:lipopolysaccharide transport protein LptA